MSTAEDAYALDLFAPELLVDPYRAYARLRANRGVHYRSQGAPCAVLSRYEDVQMALRDPRFVPVAPHSNGRPGSPDALVDLTDALPPMVRRVLDPIAACAAFDLVADFTRPLGDVVRAHGGVGTHETLGIRTDVFAAIAIGNAMLALLTHRHQLAFARRLPRLTDMAVDELLRFDTPVQRIMRRTVADVELPDGALIAADELVTVLIGAANRDRQQFVEPDQLQLDRPNAGTHLALGHSIRASFAAQFVRLMLHVAIAELMRTFSHLELADVPPPRAASYELRELTSLRVVDGARRGIA